MLVRSLSKALAIAAVLAAPLAARADEFIDRANALYSNIRTEKRSDQVLLPLLAKMELPPASAADGSRAALLPAGSSGWAAAEQWAMAAPQRAIIDALAKITKEEDPVEAMAFGQPYGADAVANSPGGLDLIKANLYTDLGDPPMLAGAKFLYLPALERIGCLVNVEATRLGAAGKPADAIRLLVDWLFFARQMADRQMYTEARWGVRTMIAALDRIRDIAYTDFRGSKALSGADIGDIQERVRADGGFLRLERLTFPKANQIAAEQVLAYVFTPKDGPNATFGQTMARLASTQRPLRLFAEAARWDKIAATHADALDTAKQLSTLYNDLAARWSWDPWDQRNAVPTDFEKMDKARYAVLAAVLPDMTLLFNDRQVLRTQMIGTRTAKGVLAFYYVNKNFPPTLAALRPRFIKSLEADPFNPDRANGKQPPLEFFVPVRDQTFGPRETPGPYEVNVLTAGGEQNFQARIGQDQFILYSVGPNGIKEFARNVSGEPARGSIGDLLLWPPVTSLIRQRLVETGALK